MTTTTTTKPANLSDSETIIAEMLRENTGSHFLDSGGAYGRHHQRNQSISPEMFKGREPASLTFRWDYPEIGLDLFHFLAENLEHDASVDKILRIIEAARDTYGLETIETFYEILRETADADGSIGGIYGEGEPMTVNTYNGEDLLSQTIQYGYASIDNVEFPLIALARIVRETEPASIARDYYRELRAEADGDDHVRIDGIFVFLQIHGGCDVRGGYTDVRAFQENGCTELGILDNAKASIFDTSIDNFYGADGNPPAYWYSDDGCHFYADGCCGCGAAPQLETFTLHKTEISPESIASVVAEAKGIADSVISDDRFNTDAERATYLEILAESLSGLPYNRADAYRIALSLFWPAEHGCILVDDDGNGYSPYTMGKLAASPH
jgi:hypothetical protein